VVISPERVLFSGEVSAVVLPAQQRDMIILTGSSVDKGSRSCRRR
jgi:F0F1-type ATP synthase epsilon subunit